MRNKPIIITAGRKYIDIDVLACAVAYKELLSLLGKNAEIILTGPFNKTVPESILSWDIKISYTAPNDPLNYDYVLVDISNPDFFEKFVVKEQIIKVFDHHYGFEEYWKNIIGSEAHIEMVGSCATLIWEEYKKHKKEGNISIISANLIYTSIISNTLNLKASITSIRDLKALQELQQHMDLSNDWINLYYKETEQEILLDPSEAIRNDTKKTIINGYSYFIAQLELWNAAKFIKNNDILEIALKSLDLSDVEHSDVKWFLTIASIEENKNYLITSSEFIKSQLTYYLNASFQNYIGTTNQLFLRKEILKSLMEDKPITQNIMEAFKIRNL